VHGDVLFVEGRDELLAEAAEKNERTAEQQKAPAMTGKGDPTARVLLRVGAHVGRWRRPPQSRRCRRRSRTAPMRGARAIEANNLSRGATTIEQNGEGYDNFTTRWTLPT
jgi:hypothetical protein